MRSGIQAGGGTTPLEMQCDAGKGASNKHDEPSNGLNQPNTAEKDEQWYRQKEREAGLAKKGSLRGGEAET